MTEQNFSVSGLLIFECTLPYKYTETNQSTVERNWFPWEYISTTKRIKLLELFSIHI